MTTDIDMSDISEISAISVSKHAWVCAALLVSLAACEAKVPTAGMAEDTAAKPVANALDPKWLDYIKTETVAESDTPVFISTTGRVTFDEENTQHVGSAVSGRVAAVKARLGEQVQVGQALVELSSPEVAQLQSDVKKAQQDLDLARKAAQRAHRLMRDGAISDKEVAQADAELMKARADVERGRAQFIALGIRGTDPMVRGALYARVAGTVVERNVLVGQEVRGDAGEPLMTITNLDTVWVQADVYEQDLGQVSPGANVRVRVPAYPGETFAGKIVYVGDVLDPQSRTVKVRCEVANASRKLKPEMFARVELEYPTPTQALYIPTQALVTDGETTRVIVVQDKRRLTPRVVQVGPEINGKQRVLHGLTAGEVIVTEGAIFLQNAVSRD